MPFSLSERWMASAASGHDGATSTMGAGAAPATGAGDAAGAAPATGAGDAAGAATATGAGDVVGAGAASGANSAASAEAPSRARGAPGTSLTAARSPAASRACSISWSQLPGTAALTTGSAAGADCAAARSDSKSASSGGASACAASSTPGTASTSTHFCAKNPPTPPLRPWRTSTATASSPSSSLIWGSTSARERPRKVRCWVAAPPDDPPRRAGSLLWRDPRGLTRSRLRSSRR